MKMSDSDEGALQIDLDRPEKSPTTSEKLKKKRWAATLKVIETDEELKYRTCFKDINVIDDLSDLIKCTKCMHSFKLAIFEGRKIHTHPILNVLMCESCCSFYGNGEFSLDEDDEDKYCRWCGEGGKIFLCSECICGFCPTCIKKHFGKQKLREIEKDDEWVCFICNPEPLWKLRAVCSMAIDESMRNKSKNDASESETPKKKFLKLRKQHTLTENVSCERADNKGLAINEDSSTSSKETQRDHSKLFRNKRKRFLASNLKGKKMKTLAYVQSDDNGEPPKKIRSISLRSRDEMKTIHSRCNSNGGDIRVSSSSSDSSDDERENNAEKLCEFDKREASLVEKSKNKNLDKLKDIFMVAETVSQLCLNMCRKKIRKLDKNLLSNEKLLPECEKLRSMIILMSCSLSTVHNLIVSLQQKCKMKENLDVQFPGKQDFTLLEGITKILRNKRMKTSCFFDLVRDILYRYPFIELGVKNFNNYVSNIVFMESMSGFIQNGACQNIKVNSAWERGGRNEKNENSKKEIRGDAKNVIPGDIMDLDFITTEDNLGKVTDETDVRTQILEPHSNHVSSNKEPSEHSPRVKERDELSSSLRENNASDSSPDMEKLYLKSLKFKEEFLISSSDERPSDDKESLIGDNLLRLSNLSTVTGKEKRRTSVTSASKTKEEREISKLMSPSFLERGTRKINSETESVEKSNLKGKELKECYSGSSNSDLTASNTNEFFSDSQMDAPSDVNFNSNHRNTIEYVQENASMMRSYFLETTSSSKDSHEDSSSEEKPKKIKCSTKSSSKLEKRELNKKDKSKWRSDNLLRTAISFPHSGSGSGTSEPKEGSTKKSNEEANESDSSFCSLNISSLKRGKRQRAVISSSSDSDIQQVHVPQPKVESPPKGRRNIKKIVKTGNLHLETRQAVKAENERKKRVADRKRIYEESFPNMLESERLVLDFDLDTKDVLLEVPAELAKKLKPHQKEGIKFMWDCCFESLESLEKTNGSGCVLAHCMGLGKTLQIITLIFTVMKNGIGIKTILILCPLNVVSNWVDEFETWLKDLDFKIDVCNLNIVKGDESRFMHLQEWQNDGGVMIISYDLMRSLTNVKRSKTTSEIASHFSELLLNPGPDLVICDEGHLLKNQGTALSKCIMKINTSRRIILTGTPLQNNLIEYHSMVQFIKPNILGTRKEFMNRFGNPIMNGQFEDSTAKDVKLMRARSHVLHKLLDGCIQRFNYSVLTPYLPEKHEYVLSIRLTESQVKLYRHYLSKCRRSFTTNKTAKLFSDFHLLQRVWTHPRLLATHSENGDHLDGYLDENKTDPSSSEDSVICLDTDIGSSSSGVGIKELLKPEEYGDIHSSGKLVLLFHILSRCRKIGDKVLVFSQSLSNLNLIEYFLHKIHLANESSSADFPSHYRDTWEKGIDYYRMEGSTSNEARAKWCKSFNNKKNKRLRLFLISTKAGGLGINLVGANRVIIFDVSWNPSQDVQSIFRIYRFGQLKTCYIYRFVAEGTMEEKIYARQVTKLSLEKRVLDEQQIERHYTMGNLQELYAFDPIPKEKWKVPLIPKDMILAEIINNKNLIAFYHEHDSLLENKEEEKLTEEERKAAWDDFEKEKFMAECGLNRYPSSNSNNVSGRSYPNMEMFRVNSVRMAYPEQSTSSVEYLPLHFHKNKSFNGPPLGQATLRPANPSIGSYKNFK